MSIGVYTNNWMIIACHQGKVLQTSPCHVSPCEDAAAHAATEKEGCGQACKCASKAEHAATYAEAAHHAIKPEDSYNKR